jgi:hypothetical protein
MTFSLAAQSADWQHVVFREPQVRYLLTDMTLSGRAELYRKYALEEKDPDSCEAIRLWDAGVRVLNTNDFERRWITHGIFTTNRYLRIVLRGSNRTITGNEPLLNSDGDFQQSPMRQVLLDLTLGGSVSDDQNVKKSPSVAEALRRWATGDRAINTNAFEVRVKDGKRLIVYRGTDKPIDGAHVRLNSDLAYPETNVRYFLADISLGGSAEFYRKIAEEAHEMGCLEAVARWDAGVRLSNLEQFERKRVNGKVLITRKGGAERISGMDVRLTTD